MGNSEAQRSEGIKVADLIDNLEYEQQQSVEQTIALLQAHNFLEKKQDRIVLTTAGLAVQNDIAHLS